MKLKEQLSSEAAENFFDQLGKGTTQSTEIRGTNPFMNQPETSTVHTANPDNYNWGHEQHIQQTSFTSETTGINAGGRGQDASKIQLGKAVPVKKKKGALPTNMFD